MATQITEHFSLEEMSATSHEDLQEQNFEYAKKHIGRLKALCDLLEQVRSVCGCPIIVTNGARCPELNTRGGGVANSQHLKCEAADIVPNGVSVEDGFGMIVNSNIMFDQLILEYVKGRRWIHISYAEIPRRQVLIYDKGKYTKV